MSSPRTGISPPMRSKLVEVDYEELPVLVDPFKALEDDAPVLREDIEGQTEGAHGPRRHHNHIFTWEVRVTRMRPRRCSTRPTSWPRK